MSFQFTSVFCTFLIDYAEQNDESDDDDYLMPDDPVAGSFICFDASLDAALN